MTTRQDMKRLLQALSKMLDQMTEEEYEQFLSGELKLGFVREDKENRKVNKISEEDLKSLSCKINELKDREEAQDFLKNDPRVHLKDNLVCLAKFLKVHVVKNDKREVVEEKIIEFVVGAKLRSEAIQGVNLKSGGGT
jgi:hypothetical protein